MTIWEILQIEPTNDARAIKKAYARQTRDCHPEENPVAFQALYEAFQAALRRAERGCVPTGYDRAANKDRTKRKFLFYEQDELPDSLSVIIEPFAPQVTEPPPEDAPPLVFPLKPLSPPPRAGELRFDAVEQVAQTAQAAEPPDFDRLIEKGLEQQQQQRRAVLSDALRALHSLRADPLTKGDPTAWRAFLRSPAFSELRIDPAFLPMLIDFLTKYGNFPNPVWLEFYSLYDFSDSSRWSGDYHELYTLLHPRYKRMINERLAQEKQRKQRKICTAAAIILTPLIIALFAANDVLLLLPPLVYMAALIGGASRFRVYTRLRGLSPPRRGLVAIGCIVGLSLFYFALYLFERLEISNDWTVFFELFAVPTIIALGIALIASFVSAFSRKR